MAPVIVLMRVYDLLGCIVWLVGVKSGGVDCLVMLFCCCNGEQVRCLVAVTVWIPCIPLRML
jgi:hypothetical protein